MKTYMYIRIIACLSIFSILTGFAMVPGLGVLSLGFNTNVALLRSQEVYSAEHKGGESFVHSSDSLLAINKHAVT